MVARCVLVFVSLLAAACGGSDTPTSPSRPPTPDPVVLAITCPTAPGVSTAATSMPVTWAAPTTTGGQAPVTVTCTPASGSTFPLGTTSVACTATDTRAATAACAFQVVVSRTPTLTRTKFMAFGDSITAGEVTVPVTSSTGIFGKLQLVPAASYPTQLRNLLLARYTTQTTELVLANMGRSGEAAVDGAIRFPSAMSTVRPDVVLLIEGYNDLNLYGPSYISRTVSYLETMTKEGRNRGARVFVGSLTPPRPGGTNSILNSTVVEFNIRLRNMAAGENAIYVDLYSALVQNLTGYIGSDGLHPTEAGYRRIAEEFFTVLQANLESR